MKNQQTASYSVLSFFKHYAVVFFYIQTPFRLTVEDIFKSTTPTQSIDVKRQVLNPPHE